MGPSHPGGAGRCIAIAIVSALVGSAAQEPPVIRVDAHLVQVDVVVRNGKGPVLGLTKDDFTLLEKGKPQRIAVFKVNDARTARNPVEPVAPLPPGVVSNRTAPSGDQLRSVTVVLVDHLNTPTDAQVYGNKQLLRFLQSAQQGDRIAIYLLSETKLEVLENFTTDLDRLRQTATNLKPEDTRLTRLLRLIAELTDPRNKNRSRDNPVRVLGPQLEEMHIDNATITAESLTAIAKNLEGLPGRKNLVWISSNFPIGIVTPSGNMRNFTPELEAATHMLNDAEVAVYPIDPRGLVVGLLDAAGNAGTPRDPLVPEASNGIVTMNTVAQATGGRAFYNDNGVSQAIRESMEDGEVTYTLGFYPEPGTLDGAFHNLQVKVAKSGVDVRYRKGYFASKDAAPADTELHDALKETIASSLDETAVGITATAESDPAAPGNYNLTVKVNLGDVHMERSDTDASWTGSIVFAYQPESDTSSNFQFAVVPIKLNQRQYETALKDGYNVQAPIHVASGAGRVRAIVQDRTTGAAGSVWVPLGAK